MTDIIAATFRADLLRGKTAFIAGGTSGINFGIAKSLGVLGARVAVLSRSQDKVTAAVTALEAAGGTAKGFAADVRTYDQVTAALKATAADWGPLDIIISGAAGNFIAPAAKLSANAFKTVVDIDLLGTFNVLRAGYEVCRKPGCSMINISAPQSTEAYWGQAHVSAAKAGIDMLTRSLAAEWGPEGIRVNAIVPGPIGGTEGMARLAPTPAAVQAAEAGVPLRRFGTTDDIAATAIFLSSPAANYVTGGIFYCDGGVVLSGTTALSPPHR